MNKSSQGSEKYDSSKKFKKKVKILNKVDKMKKTSSKNKNHPKKKLKKNQRIYFQKNQKRKIQSHLSNYIFYHVLEVCTL